MVYEPTARRKCFFGAHARVRSRRSVRHSRSMACIAMKIILVVLVAPPCLASAGGQQMYPDSRGDFLATKPSNSTMQTATLSFHFDHWCMLPGCKNDFTEKSHMVAKGKKWGHASFGPSDLRTGISSFAVVAGMVRSVNVSKDGFRDQFGIPFKPNNVYQTYGYAGQAFPEALEFVVFGNLVFRPMYGPMQIVWGVDMAVGKLGDRWWLASHNCEGRSADPPAGFVCGNDNWIGLTFY
eukprot:TRINITY_DN17328_c0_g1_i1.p1 TRINITY_DN17328_c0_g1~~TRINITY_DN17328_c0_g1_i1.p1  ORF type:complete len:238 (+),score=24.32 TRINITY_DN17328_c0_g1_i1:142-855(+)